MNIVKCDIVNIVNYDRMAVYLWSEPTDPHECKFGECWVPAGVDLETAVKHRIRASLGIRKDKFSDLILHKYWDVTELAKKTNRYYPKARLDDYIRGFIGHRKGTTGEVHTLSGATFVEKLLRLFHKWELPLPQVNLTIWQIDLVKKLLELRTAGKQCILAELCARFGKTIMTGAFIKESKNPVTVIAYYVKTVQTSFLTDLLSFAQFGQFAVINAEDADYRQQIRAALNAKQQVVVLLPLTNSVHKDARIRALFSTQRDTALFIDEADFGAHKPKSMSLLKKYATAARAFTVIMTGTNGDRAASSWAIDHALSVVYPELLIEKKTSTRTVSSLPSFPISIERSQLIPEIVLFRYNLEALIAAYKQAHPEYNPDEFACWNKLFAHPFKHKAFIIYQFRGIFSRLDRHFDEAGVKQLRDRYVNMMFVPGSATVRNVHKFCVILQEALPGWKIVEVTGRKTNNEKAESYVREAMEKYADKNILIVSRGMAARSFSVGEIDTILLAYDNGEVGQTIQKISRGLTPHDPDKITKIVSLAFDGNLDDKFDLMITETAKNFSQNAGISFKMGLQQVLKTLDIFDMSEEGPIRFDLDTYTKELLHKDCIAKTIGKLSDPSRLTADQLDALANASVGSTMPVSALVMDKGRTYAESTKTQSTSSTREKMSTFLKAKVKIAQVCENIDYLVAMTDASTVTDALQRAKKSTTFQEEIERAYDVERTLFFDLFDKAVVNLELLEFYDVKRQRQTTLPYLLRHTLDESVVAKELLRNIPQKKIVNGIVYDQTVSSGSILEAVISIKRNAGKTDREIKCEVFGKFPNPHIKKYLLKKMPLLELVSEVTSMSTFRPDVILGNPPYSGVAQLHQQFFNEAVNLVKDGGYVVFIQPATPYLNKKSPRKHEKIMKENVIRYLTKVKIVGRDVFTAATIENDLAITTLHKVENATDKLIAIEYKNKEVFQNIDLNDVNFHGLSPDIWNSINKKYDNFIAQHGSLLDKTYHSYGNQRNKIAGLTKIRSGPGTNRFFTFLSKDDNDSNTITSTTKDVSDFGILIDNDNQLKNVYQYLKTYVARFGLSLIKINHNNHRGEFAKVPLVDFNKQWTDAQLIKMLDLTDEEFAIMKQTLGNYHNLPY